MRKRIKQYVKNKPLALSTVFVLMSLSLTNHAFAAAKRIKVYEPNARQLAPKLRLKDLAGNTYTLDSNDGEVRIVNFWSSWCVPCIKEMPSLEGLHQEFKDQKVNIVAVAVGESMHEVRKFQQTSDVKFPLMADADSSVSEAWDVFAVPTSYIIDREGYIAVRVVGEYDWQSDEIRQLVREISHSTGT